MVIVLPFLTAIVPVVHGQVSIFTDSFLMLWQSQMRPREQLPYKQKNKWEYKTSDRKKNKNKNNNNKRERERDNDKKE